ncbi:hypothetical protein Tco_0786798 [Tanacetum coccineum]
MDAAVQQSSVDKQCLEIAKKEILLENDRLLQKIMSQDVMLTVMNSMSLNNDSVNMEMQECESCEKCLNLDAELSKSKQAYNDFLKNYSQLEKHSRLQDKDKTICKLKTTIKSLSKNTKEKNVNHDKCELETINKELENNVAKLLFENERKEIVENVVHTPSATTIALVEQAKAKQPLDSELDFACKYAIRIQELLVYVQDTCPNVITPSAKKVESLNTSDSNTHVWSSTGVKCSTSNYGSKPPGNKNNDRISQITSRNKKNKVEAQHRKVNKVNRVVKPVCDVDVKHSLSKANSEILYATCNKSMFDGVHDKCILDLVVQIVLWYMDSGYSKHMTGNRSQLMNFVSKFLDLEVAFWKNTCFIRKLEGVDLLSGSRDTNLYTISLDDMLKSSLICLLSQASKTKSWLWHR